MTTETYKILNVMRVIEDEDDTLDVVVEEALMSHESVFPSTRPDRTSQFDPSTIYLDLNAWDRRRSRRREQARDVRRRFA